MNTQVEDIEAKISCRPPVQTTEAIPFEFRHLCRPLLYKDSYHLSSFCGDGVLCWGG